MRRHFKLLTAKSQFYWSEKVSKGCRKGVWQRKEDRCVYREGGYEQGEEAKSSFMCHPHPFSHLHPCGIFLHEWLCHTWGTKWTLSLFLCLSPSFVLPLLLYVCTVNAFSQAWLVMWYCVTKEDSGITGRGYYCIYYLKDNQGQLVQHESHFYLPLKVKKRCFTSLSWHLKSQVNGGSVNHWGWRAKGMNQHVMSDRLHYSQQDV